MHASIPIDTIPLKALCSEYRLSLVILFGSSVTGKSGPEPDIDIGILREESKEALTGDAYLKLVGRFMELFRNGSVDVVVLNRSNPLLKFHATHTGVLLFEKNHGDFARFKLHALKEHMDAGKFYDREKKYLEEYIGELHAR